MKISPDEAPLRISFSVKGLPLPFSVRILETSQLSAVAIDFKIVVLPAPLLPTKTVILDRCSRVGANSIFKLENLPTFLRVNLKISITTPLRVSWSKSFSGHYVIPGHGLILWSVDTPSHPVTHENSCRIFPLKWLRNTLQIHRIFPATRGGVGELVA